jgi:hypothetical protein
MPTSCGTARSHHPKKRKRKETIDALRTHGHHRRHRRSHPRRSTPLAPHRPRLRPNLPFLSLSLSLDMAQSTASSARCALPARRCPSCATQPPRRGGRSLASRTVRLGPTLPHCSFYQIHCAARDPMVVGTLVGGVHMIDVGASRLLRTRGCL